MCMVTDFKKYESNGWGLSTECFKYIIDIMNSDNITRVLEFGSGKSTYFLRDMGVDYISFDDSTRYAADLKNVFIRELVQISDDDFNDVIKNKKSFFDVSEKSINFKISTRQRNCFYNVQPDDITGRFDMVIVDGPHGNGRGIAYSIIKEYIRFGGYIVIDDFTHYPFVEYLKNTFNNAETVVEHKNEFGIYKI
jgi:hypothetical protein